MKVIFSIFILSLILLLLAGCSSSRKFGSCAGNKKMNYYGGYSTKKMKV